jgi:hypothetical protein
VTTLWFGRGARFPGVVWGVCSVLLCGFEAVR